MRAGELDARVTDLNKELERVHADLGAERQRVTIDRAKAEKIEQQQQAKLARLEADRDEARKEAQLKAVENSRLVGELEALKAQVKEQTAIIKGMAATGERKASKKGKVGEPELERR